MTTYTVSTLPQGNITFSTTSATGATGSIYTTSGSNGVSWSSVTSSSNLDVKGSAIIDGDLIVGGRSITKMLEKIEDRLAILQEPDPAKLEKYAALKKAYEQYKLLEKLIGEE